TRCLVKPPRVPRLPLCDRLRWLRSVGYVPSVLRLRAPAPLVRFRRRLLPRLRYWGLLGSWGRLGRGLRFRLWGEATQLLRNRRYPRRQILGQREGLILAQFLQSLVEGLAHLQLVRSPFRGRLLFLR